MMRDDDDNDDNIDWSAKIREQNLLERRNARIAANAFARVCKEGDAHMLYHAALLLNECDAWRPAMAKVAKLPCVSREVQNAFLAIWIESKALPLRVGHRRVLVDALRVLFPCNYSGPSLTLYRGAGSNERQRRLYGLAWTTNIDVARKFAEDRAVPARKVAAKDSANHVIEISCPAREGIILQT